MMAPQLFGQMDLKNGGDTTNVIETMIDRRSFG
jgi:hypothetical protein